MRYSGKYKDSFQPSVSNIGKRISTVETAFSLGLEKLPGQSLLWSGVHNVTFCTSCLCCDVGGVFCWGFREHQHPPQKIPNKNTPKILFAHFLRCRVRSKRGRRGSDALGEIQRTGGDSDLPQVQDAHPQGLSPLACGVVAAAPKASSRVAGMMCAANPT